MLGDTYLQQRADVRVRVAFSPLSKKPDSDLYTSEQVPYITGDFKVHGEAFTSRFLVGVRTLKPYQWYEMSVVFLRPDLVRAICEINDTFSVRGVQRVAALGSLLEWDPVSPQRVVDRDDIAAASPSMFVSKA